MTRAITVFLSGSDATALTAYAERVADLIDEAMQVQEQSAEMPSGLKYDGVSVVDPDEPEAPEVIVPEIVEPEQK